MAQVKARSRIFVVDDEFIIASTLATILDRNGFEALAFTDPREALDSLGVKPPDLLITDVVMPWLSGIDLAIAFRQRRPQCRILLFSGQAATANMLEQARAEGYDFELLAKPIHPSDLLRKIRTAVEEPVA